MGTTRCLHFRRIVLFCYNASTCRTERYCAFRSMESSRVGDQITFQPTYVKTIRSCSLHGVVAARLTSERPGNFMPLSKNISCFGIAFTPSVTVDVFERDIKRFAMRAQYFPSYQFVSSLPSQQQLESNVVTAVRVFVLCANTKFPAGPVR